jgi:hypothetical protein
MRLFQHAAEEMRSDERRMSSTAIVWMQMLAAGDEPQIDADGRRYAELYLRLSASICG